MSKSIRKVAAAAAVLLAISLLTACGSNEKSSGNGGNNTLPENNNTPRGEQQGRITNVTSPKFQLSDGFIVPIEKQTNAPDGWVGISTVAEFDKIRLNPSGKYILLNDIDLSVIEDYKYTNLSGGILDGNAHMVTATNTNVFYLENEAEIKNLSVVLAGKSLLGSFEDSQINNCWISGLVQADYRNVGTFSGSVSKSTIIKNCYNTAKLQFDSSFVNSCSPLLPITIGGLVGAVYATDSNIIENSYNAADILFDFNFEGEVIVGGIIGEAGDDSIITNCFNAGNIIVNSAKRSSVHGVCGGYYSSLKSTIEGCFNSGDLEANCEGGGTIHGLGKGNFTNCYNKGDLKGEFVIGLGWGNSYENCYVNGTFSGSDICAVDSKFLKHCYFLDKIENSTRDGRLLPDASIKKLTIEQMKDKSSFIGFDFNNVWEMGGTNYPYPVFKAMYS